MAVSSPETREERPDNKSLSRSASPTSLTLSSSTFTEGSSRLEITSGDLVVSLNEAQYIG